MYNNALLPYFIFPSYFTQSNLFYTYPTIEKSLPIKQVNFYFVFRIKSKALESLHHHEKKSERWNNIDI